MRRLLSMVLGFGLCACGPAWSGKVSGYELNTREAVFTNVTDDKGQATAGLMVLSDQPDTCTALATAKAPPNATFVVFVLGRKADNNWLSPDVGDYVVTNGTGTAAAFTNAIFIRSDANGTNSLPVSNRITTSGKLEVSQWAPDRGVAAAQFEGKFGIQNDSVHAAFTANWCAISTESLANGFVSKEFNSLLPGSTPPPAQPTQSSECSAMISCWRATNGASSTQGTLDNTYGATGTCWIGSQSTADRCTADCRSELSALRSATNAPAACFQ